MSTDTFSPQPPLRRSERTKRCSLELDLNEIQESDLSPLNESSIYNPEEKHCLTSHDLHLEKSKGENNDVPPTNSSAVNNLNTGGNGKRKSVFNEDILGGDLDEENSSSANYQSTKALKYDKGEKKKCKGKSESSDPISKSFKSSLRGVYFHFLKQEWRAVLGHGSRRQQKTFSVCKYGFDAAKQFAEHLRTQYELSGYVNDTRFTGCHRKSKKEKCSKGKKPSGITSICKNPKVKTVQKSFTIEPLPTFPPINSLSNRKALEEWIRSISEIGAPSDETSLKTPTLQNNSNQSCYDSSKLHAIRQIIDSGAIEAVELHDVLVDYLSSPPLRRWEPLPKNLVKNNDKSLSCFDSAGLDYSASNELMYEQTCEKGVTEKSEKIAHPVNNSFASNILKSPLQHLQNANKSSIQKPLHSLSEQNKTVKQNHSITHSFNELNETVTHLLFST